MRYLFFPLLALVLLSSCQSLGGEKIRGNGDVVTGRRNIEGFNRIEADGAVEVRIKQEPTYSVKVETDENLFDYLEVNTDGNTLYIRAKSGYNLQPSDKILVYVSAPGFHSISVSGASKIFSDGTLQSGNLSLDASGASQIRLQIKVTQLQTDITGASNLQLMGTATQFDLDASGASKVQCLDLDAAESHVEVSGASSAQLSASRQLTIEASGASRVEYRGNASVQQNSSGASRIKKIG